MSKKMIEITKLEYFAAKVLPEVYRCNNEEGHGMKPEEIAADAFLIAKAMVEESNRIAVEKESDFVDRLMRVTR